MRLKSRFSSVTGAVALALGSSLAMANTNLDATSTGDLFINVIDTTVNSSFVFDTGVSQASFNGASGNYSFTLSNDANYKAFLAAEGPSDAIDYSILSAQATTGGTPTATVLFTSNQSPIEITGTYVSQAQSLIAGFLTQANKVTSATTNSAFITAASTVAYGSSNYQPAIDSDLSIPYTGLASGDAASPGTPLAFYSDSSNALRSAITNATLTQLAGTWNFVNGIVTYASGGGGNSGGGGSGTVPLPAPVLLLLSGLGLMGLVARRARQA